MTLTSQISIFLRYFTLSVPLDLNAPWKYPKEPGDQLFSSYNYNQLKLEEFYHDENISYELDFHGNEFGVFGCRLGSIVRVFFVCSSRKLSLLGEFPGGNQVDGLPPAYR